MFHCVGCGGRIPWDGKGIFAYTCPCGATVFSDGKRPAFPASLIMRLYKGQELPHIDYYVGVSNYISQEKEELIQFLKEKGAIWTWECPECKDKKIARLKEQIKWNLVHIPLHPELAKLV